MKHIVIFIQDGVMKMYFGKIGIIYTYFVLHLFKNKKYASFFL